MRAAAICNLVGTLPGVLRRRLVFSPVKGEDDATWLAGDVVVTTTATGGLSVLLTPGRWRLIGLGKEAMVTVPRVARAELQTCLTMKE